MMFVFQPDSTLLTCHCEVFFPKQSPFLMRRLLTSICLANRARTPSWCTAPGGASVAARCTRARSDMSRNPTLRQVAHIVERVFDLLCTDRIIVVAVFEESGFGFLDCQLTDCHISLQDFFDQRRALGISNNRVECRDHN